MPAISGQVIDADGRPSPGALIEMSRKPGTHGPPFALTLTADENGQFAYGGQQQWVLWMVPADWSTRIVQISARDGERASNVRDVEFGADVHMLGLGKPKHHDVGELRLNPGAPSE